MKDHVPFILREWSHNMNIMYTAQVKAFLENLFLHMNKHLSQFTLDLICVLLPSQERCLDTELTSGEPQALGRLYNVQLLDILLLKAGNKA